MLGAVVSDGGVGVGVEPGATVAVGAESAEPLPKAFDAVTVTRVVVPTSLEPSVYDWLVAPEMEVQLAPSVAQRPHW